MNGRARTGAWKGVFDIIPLQIFGNIRADGDYEHRDRRLAEIVRLQGILRASRVSDGGGGSAPPCGLRKGRDVVEEMAKVDRG